MAHGRRRPPELHILHTSRQCPTFHIPRKVAVAMKKTLPTITPVYAAIQNLIDFWVELTTLTGKL
jgi:hypothetical protein